jgi:hypothetical protein
MPRIDRHTADVQVARLNVEMQATDGLVPCPGDGATMLLQVRRMRFTSDGRLWT